MRRVLHYRQMELPSEDALRWIVRSLARLRAAHGEAFGAPALVQPTGEFFPDAFERDPASVERLLRRMMTYSPLAEDLGIELAFFAPEGDHSGGCGSAACGPRTGGAGARTLLAVDEMDDGYRLRIAVNDVANPEVLTAVLARAVGELVLHEAGEDADDPAEAELVAAACGLGVLLANGAAVWAKSCGGLRMAQATALPVDEAAVALALFVATHGAKRSAAVAHLHATQREAYDLAEVWVESNPRLVEAMRGRPALLEAGLFSMEPTRGLLGRWLHKRKVDREQDAPAALAPTLTDDKRRRMEEARALVDEVLGGE
jgi:hypothetical protein